MRVIFYILSSLSGCIFLHISYAKTFKDIVNVELLLLKEKIYTQTYDIIVIVGLRQWTQSIERDFLAGTLPY